MREVIRRGRAGWTSALDRGSGRRCRTVWPNTDQKDIVAHACTDLRVWLWGRTWRMCCQSLCRQFLPIFHSLRRLLGLHTVELSGARELYSARSHSCCFIPVYCHCHSHFLGKIPRASRGISGHSHSPSRRYSWPFYSCAAGRCSMKMHYFALVRRTQDGWGHTTSLHAAPAWSIELNFTSLTYASASESSPSSSEPCFPHFPSILARWSHLLAASCTFRHTRRKICGDRGDSLCSKLIPYDLRKAHFGIYHRLFFSE